MGQFDAKLPVDIDRNARGFKRYAFHNGDAVWLAEFLDQVERDRLEPEQARELFRRELRLFVPESAVR